METRKQRTSFSTTLAHRQRSRSHQPPRPRPTPFIAPRVNYPLPDTPVLPTEILPFIERAPRSIDERIPLQESSGSSPETGVHHAIELRCYYPEQIFLALVLPTRSRRETLEFKNHCREAWNQRTHSFVTYTHPVDEIRQFSTNPLSFVNYLWKVRTVLSFAGITEEYAYIKRDIRPDGRDRAIPQPAYSVFYPWTENNWTVTLLV